MVSLPASPPQASHGHAHGSASHAGHAHAHGTSVTDKNARRIRFVFFFTLGYAVIQAIGGWFSGSLALIADSGHMVSDAAALFLALVAYRVANRAPDLLRTYGFHRVRVLAALANGASLFLLVIWITWEAIQRLRQPTEILSGPMLVVAIIGLIVNLVGFFILQSGNQGDTNLRGALLHVLGDLLGSVGAILAAVGILLTGWTFLDPLLSILVALLVIRSAWGLMKDSLHVLLQAAPPGLDTQAAETSLLSVPGVAEAGHLHVWTLADDSLVATVHVSPQPGIDPLVLPARVTETLRHKYSIQHVTVQVDPFGQLSSSHETSVCSSRPPPAAS